MAPPKRANIGKNWNALKKEVEKPKKNVTINDNKPKKLSKGKRKDRRQKIYQEALNLLDASKKSEASIIARREKAPLVTPAIGLDCEYVGVGWDGFTDQLARVSIVNEKGETLYDKYVKPVEPVVNYRTSVSGIQPGHLVNGIPFSQAQKEVQDLMTNRIVVGHALDNDFRVLKLSHPYESVRDTSAYYVFRDILDLQASPSLKMLAWHFLGIRIQDGEHDSVIDAKAAMSLYMLYRKKWEKDY